jgi:hypothetical protein
MSDADTPPRGLTTDQIAAGGTTPDQDDVLAPDDRDYDNNNSYDNNSYDNNSYDNAAPFATDQASPGYADRSATGTVNGSGATGTVNGGGVAGTVNGDGVAGTVNGGGVAADSGARASLLDDSELQSMTMRWKDIQAEFVDEPAEAVQEADALVAELMQRLAAMFSTQRAELETRLASDNEVSTEDLRQGLRRYRSFFERLLAA